MKRWLSTLALAALYVAPLRADVRVTSTTTLEGALAAMMGGSTPRVVMHIKGLKARADIEAGPQTMSTITDAGGKEVILLNAAEKTARILTPGAVIPSGTSVPVPKIDVDAKATGRTQTIAGLSCEEVALTMSMSMAEMAGSTQAPPEAAEMMKSIRLLMKGSMWSAKSGPGVAEYVAFQTAAMKGNLTALLGAVPGLRSAGLDRMMEAFGKAGGIPYLTELTMTIEGNDQIAEIMKQQGPIKVITRVTDVSTAPIADELFAIPEGYQVVK